ncbi:MAG: guanylate kinase [Candidatus Moranbacteria bacterium]|nr:guanylate kinase [Candidatus Moranbacteria bacterium]
MKEPKIFIISGSVGAGKDTILRQLKQKRDDLYWAITTTSRKPRSGEIEGQSYYFISPEKFRELINRDAFFEYENVYADKYFGMTRKEINKALQENKNIIWQIDYRGYNTIKDKLGGRIVSIFILPPSLEIAKKRIQKRSRENKAFIEERLELAKKEIEASKNYDYRVINKEDQLDKAVEEILKIIDKEIKN